MYIRGADDLLSQALRPGTRANHQTALKMFIEFNAEFGLDYTRPTVSVLCGYVFYLSLKYSNPNTILNYVSSLSSVFKRLNFDTLVFRSFEFTDILMSVKNNIRHTPVRRMAIPMSALSLIISALSFDPEGPTVTCAVLIMFFTFLRQSNLAPRTKKTFDPSRHLLRSDVIDEGDAIIIRIKWSKTYQGPTATSVAAPALPSSPLCPVAAYRNLLASSPTFVHRHPLLSFGDGSAMPLSYLNRAWDLALRRCHMPPRVFTLHSLRRGGATSALESGAASIEHIRAHGTWNSDAVNVYLPNDPRRSQVYQQFKDIMS